jgi:3-isopropylmalate/(R)-2-methylmalate dehydratase small subunit
LKPFLKVKSVAAPLPVSHIDTDQILPARYMKTLSRSGLGKHLFHDWRFEADGSEVADFVLNRPLWRNAEILLTHENFGCGSSREHAVWALDDFGIRAIIAPSFGSIFATNCVKNGVLPVPLSWAACAQLMKEVATLPDAEITVDLTETRVTAPSGTDYPFDIQADIRNALLSGKDDISRTLEHDDALAAFERRQGRIQ